MTILTKKAKKSLFGQNLIFLAKNAKIFKNKKLIKKVRKHSLDSLHVFRWLWRICCVFFTLVKKIWAKKSLFWRFLKNTTFSQKSDDLNRFLLKFPF